MRGRGSRRLQNRSQMAKEATGHVSALVRLHSLLTLEIILRRDTDHHHQCRIRDRLRSPENPPQPLKRSSHSAAGMFLRIRALDGQRHLRNDLRLQEHWSCGTGSSARWDQEKSSCYQRLAGGKNWTCSLVRAHTTCNVRVASTLTLRPIGEQRIIQQGR
jgi:hypothetical protein